MGAVGFGVEQSVGLAGVRRGDLEDPAFGEGIGIHESRIAIESYVDGDDLARNGGVDVAGGFDGLDDGDGFSGFHLATDGGQVNEDDVGEFGLGMIGDADGGGGFAGLDPFVGGAVAEVIEDGTHGGIGAG